MILGYGAAVAVAALSAGGGHAAVRTGNQSVSTTLAVSVTVVSSCAVAVTSEHTSVRCNAAHSPVYVRAAHGRVVTLNF